MKEITKQEIKKTIKTLINWAIIILIAWIINLIITNYL